MHSSEHEVLDALDEPSCAICRLSADAGRAYLGGVLRDGVNDEAIRADWRRRGGLCRRHWRTWRGLESALLGTLIVTRDLLGTYIESGAPEPVDCRACRTEAEAERRYLTVLRSMPAASIETRLRAGRGFVCLRHLAGLEGTPLAGALRRRLVEIHEDLTESIRKSDYRFASEPHGAERDSWLRAIRALGGDV